MRVTVALRQWCIRATLFTKPNCSLCSDAKQVLDTVWKRRPFEFTEIDISKSGQQKWKSLYEFDVPVLHVDKVKENAMRFETGLEAGKLMHKFNEADVEKLMDNEMMQPADDVPDDLSMTKQ